MPDKKQIADSMNEYFGNTGCKLSSKIPNIENPVLNGDYSTNKNHECFRLQMIRPDDLSKIMNKLKTSHSAGIEGISSLFLKIGMPFLAKSKNLYVSLKRNTRQTIGCLKKLFDV